MDNRTSFNNGFDEFHIIDYMPRYQTKKKSYYSPPEITRIIKYIKGNPKIKITYDPRLDYSIGKTKSYDKSNFIVSISENENYETLYLYSNASLNAIINNESIYLDEMYKYPPIYALLLYFNKYTLCELTYKEIKLSD